MGTVVDIYQLVRDLIAEAKEVKNLEMVNQLIEIKLALSEMQEENNSLKKRIEELEQTKVTDPKDLHSPLTKMWMGQWR